jgi:hypothetical protein
MFVWLFVETLLGQQPNAIYNILLWRLSKNGTFKWAGNQIIM